MTLTQLIVAALTGLCVGFAATLVLAWLRELSITPLPIHVIVTQQDISEGWSIDFVKCPVAVAIRRSLPYARSVQVLPDENEDYIEIDGIRYEAPSEVVQWIDDFDNEGEGQPFEFYLFQTATD